MRNLFDGFFQNAVKAAIDKLKANQSANYSAAYFPPTNIEDDWYEARKRLIRMDEAVFALRIYAARCLFKSLPGEIAKRLRQMEIGLGKFVGVTVAGFFFKIVLKKVVGILADMVTIWDSSKVQKAAEAEIKRHCVIVIRDSFRNSIMKPAAGRKRHRDVVYTRNPGPRQRRANHA